MNRPRTLAPTLALMWAIALFAALEQPSSTQSSILFRADFNASSTNYNFAGRYPTGSWHVNHLPTGGWNGSGAPHIVMHAGQVQYNLGWWTPAFSRSFAMGDGVYIRFRIKYDEAMRAPEMWGNKLIMMGTTGTNPNSRIIVHMRPVSESSGCTLGMRDWNSPSSPEYAWAKPDYFGISGFSTFQSSSLRLVSWSIAPAVNISWACSPPVFQTIPSNPYNGRPGPANSARSSDGWTHIQIYAQSGNAGQGLFRVWANNNSQGSPSSQQTGLADGLGVQGWSQGITVGGYSDASAPSSDLGFVLDDLEVGNNFDPAWYGGSSAPSGPSAPSNLRILSSN